MRQLDYDRDPSTSTKQGLHLLGIVAGEVSSTTIAQSEKAIAFMDTNPVTSGHVLVIPGSHATDLFDLTADDLAACVQPGFGLLAIRCVRPTRRSHDPRPKQSILR
ncbi:MAG: HIT domain-containing protein [bacterium]|nr:HIT domain-containing protein [bacterium]